MTWVWERSLVILEGCEGQRLVQTTFIFFLLSLLGDSIFKCFREKFSYRRRLWRPSFEMRSFLLGDSISKLNLWRPSLEMRKRSLILSDTIFKLNLNVKAVKAEFLDEKEKFTSWWFNFQVEYWFSSWLSFGRL